MRYSKIGIDISEWQADINFKKAVESGVEFVLIRSSYGWKNDSQKDKCFEANIKGFGKLKIPCGIYHYSYASNTEEAILEARFCLKCLGDIKPELPVYYDMEEEFQAKLGKKVCTEMAEAFCNEIQKNGLKAGVYANANWFTNYLDYKELSKSYSIWLAQWADAPQMESSVWQYTSKGKIAGINGDVDMNYMFVNEKDDVIKEEPKAPDSVQLKKAKLYVSSTAAEHSGTVTGSYWLWSTERVNGRIRITNSKNNVGKEGQVTGWIDTADIGETAYRSYTVKKGDTLWGIAERFLGNGLDYKKIMSYNSLTSETIYEGQVLKIPE